MLYIPSFLSDQPPFNPKINQHKATAPIANTVSPKTRSQRKASRVGFCRNSAERAYQRPYFTLATVCARPMGSMLTTTIKNNPMLMVQKANRSVPSFHTFPVVKPFITKSIRPIPNMPYTPNNAEWPCTGVVFKPCI